MFEVFEHTADVGLRVRAGDLNELFAEAALGYFSLVAANLDSVRPVQEVAFKITGNRLDDLLFDWLAELLYTFDTKHLLLSHFDVKTTDTGLEATARGEPVDPERHELDMEIKAITYHGLIVERDAGGWLAEVIVDL
jgi:SHS2 domain-containing protein